MKNFSTLNTLSGWIVFLIASFTFLSTLEPTASFWDCGEFIAASFKLQVGHPPGAPLFLLLGRFFSMFAGNDTSKVALMVNALSGLASAFTVMFLFWTISHLAKRILNPDDEPSLPNKISIIGSALVGSLAYTFSDTFWFSAVEGEVYASSSLFTAVVFWAILKWENVADEKYADRWLILIAYLMGLSIGIHLLNLLAIPAIVLIYYFKKYKVSPRGVLTALIIAAAILAGIIYVVIPGFVKFAALFERFFVNAVGFPYWSGVIIYLLILIGLIAYLIDLSRKRARIVLNTIVLSIAVILIGYSSYALVVIRSNANTPMDQNNPENLFNLLSYLNREQYGDRPLLFGQYFNAPIIKESEGNAVYAPKGGRYEKISFKPKYTYHPDFKTFMPRMYSNQADHIDAYLHWTGISKDEMYTVRKDAEGKIVRDRYGDVVYDYSRPMDKPGFIKNMVFLVRYQLGYMYFRYFMWNFSGRQNDIQGFNESELLAGNWITGIKFLDEARLGNQDKLTAVMLSNKARNTLFMLPLILGLLGLVFQYSTDRKNFWVVMSLFFFTGVAIVLYLNQTPLQPRERDYAYAGSFYAYAIWIGLSVVAFVNVLKIAGKRFYKTYGIRALILIAVLIIFDFSWNGTLTFTWSVMFVLGTIMLLILAGAYISKNIRNNTAVSAIAVLLFLAVPVLMAFENWDDHNRSGRYMARDFAGNYLNSCEKNSILYTNGDNDTFPLWYVQEVEGVRTDVRVINLSYLSADWYIQQMHNRAYDSPPIEMTLTSEQYQQGKREIVYFFDRVKSRIDLMDAINFIASDKVQESVIPGMPEQFYHFPQHKFSFKADSAIVFSNGTIKPQMADRYVSEMQWDFSRNYVTKNHLMALDFMATNNWRRPIYYAITVGNDNYIELNKFFEMHGLAYRVVPALTGNDISFGGGINTAVMYDNMMNKYRWGGIENDGIYLDENCLRMLSNMRHNFSNLARSLIDERKEDSAKQVMERCITLFPDEKIPFDLYSIALVENYYRVGMQEMAQEIASKILEHTYADVEYFLSLESRFAENLPMERRIAGHVLSELMKISDKYGDKRFSAAIDQQIQDYGPGINSLFR